MSLTFGEYVYPKHLLSAHRNLIHSNSLKVPGIGKQIESIKGVPVCTWV